MLLKKYDLKTRKLIGNTSMDPELSLIMANMGQARPGSLVLDPFCGSGTFIFIFFFVYIFFLLFYFEVTKRMDAGSMLFTSAEFGAMVIGCDINATVLHGWGKTSRAKMDDKRRSAWHGCELRGKTTAHVAKKCRKGRDFRGDVCPVWDGGAISRDISGRQRLPTVAA